MSQQTPASSLGDPTIFQLPAHAPPPGVSPDIAHPKSREPLLVTSNGILLAIMTVSIILRAYRKLAMARKVSWNDLTVSLSAIGAIALYVFFVFGKALPSRVTNIC